MGGLALPGCRIAARDATHHISTDEATIQEAYRRSAALELPFDAVIENVGLPNEAILRPFRQALSIG